MHFHFSVSWTSIQTHYVKWAQDKLNGLSGLLLQIKCDTTENQLHILQRLEKSPQRLDQYTLFISSVDRWE